VALTTKRLAAGRYVIEAADGGRWDARRRNLAWVGTLSVFGVVMDELEADSLGGLKELISETAERRLPS